MSRWLLSLRHPFSWSMTYTNRGTRNKGGRTRLRKELDQNPDVQSHVRMSVKSKVDWGMPSSIVLHLNRVRRFCSASQAACSLDPTPTSQALDLHTGFHAHLPYTWILGNPKFLKQYAATPQLVNPIEGQKICQQWKMSEHTVKLDSKSKRPQTSFLRQHLTMLRLFNMATLQPPEDTALLGQHYTTCRAMPTIALPATHWLIFDTAVRNCSVLAVYTMFFALTKHTGLIMKK